MKKYLQLARTVLSLPRISIALGRDENGLRFAKHFNARHKKMPLVKQKELGVALIELDKFRDFPAYLASVSGKNSAAYFSRRSERAGYTFGTFDPNSELKALLDIHGSAGDRQGKEIEASYLDPDFRYPVGEGNQYFAIRKEGSLVAYVWLISTGELCLMNRIMGHKDHLKQGIMYQLVVNLVSELLSSGHRSSKLMYDTMLGGSEGLKLFKKRLGFSPYKVTWKPGS